MKHRHLPVLGYLGIAGSHSHTAAELLFGETMDLRGFPSFREIVSEVEKKTIDMGILPIENSLSGSIFETYDQLLISSVSIVQEVYLPIHHCLLSKTDRSLRTMKRCYTHPEVAKQCKTFLEQHGDWSLEFTTDSATAAKRLQEEKADDSCAIASIQASRLFNLNIRHKNIEDNPFNMTRFVCVSKEHNIKGNKASVLFSLKHTPGTLLRSLEAFSLYKYNLTKIESRPVYGKPFEYIFFVDVEMNNADAIPKVLGQMKEQVNFIKVLGIYEKGKKLTIR